MTNSTNEPSPTENPLLTKLKEKWEAGDFAIDKDSVYGIDETVRDAGKRLTENPDTILSYEEAWCNINTAPDDSPTRPSQDPLPHHKTCRFCEQSSRNNPCDECYTLIRSAGEFIPTNHTHPCLICEEKDILTAICVDCMNTLLE